MPLSPACTVNGSASPGDVSASSTVTVALAVPAGVRAWFLQVIAGDETTNVAAIQATLQINQTNKTATFTAPSSLGSCVILQSTVGIGNSTQQGFGTDANNQPQASYTTTFKVNVKTAANLRVLALNEVQEQGANGWTLMLNAVIRAVAAATLAVSGSGLVHQTGGATDSTAYKGTAGQALFTNAAASDTAWASISGDVSASTSTPGKFTVTGLQNVPLPAPSGSGTVLTYAGGLLSWGTPSTGFTSLTGVDVVAADSAHAYVQSISGSGGAGGTIPVNATSLTFGAPQTSAGVGQATASAGQSPTNFVISPQGPNGGATSGHQTPGSLVVALAAPVGSGSNAQLSVTEGGTALFGVGNIVGIASTSFLWLGTSAPTPNSTNYTIAVDNGNDLLLNAPGSAGVVNITLSAGTGVIQATLGTSNTTGNFLIYGGSTGWNIAQYQPNYIEWTPNAAQVEVLAAGEIPTTTRYFTALNPNLEITTTQIPTGSGVTYFGNAISNPASAPAGGALLYASGGALFVYQSNGTSFQISPGGGGGVVTGVDVAGVDNAHVYVVSISGSAGGGGTVPVGTFSQPVALQYPSALGNVLVYCGAQSILLNDGANNPQWNGNSSVQVLVGGVSLATFTTTGMNGIQLPSALSGFAIAWYSNTTTAAQGAEMSLQPQFSTNGNASGGGVAVQLQSPSGSGSEAFLSIQRAATYNGAFQQILQLGAVPGSSGLQGGIFGKGLTPSATNYGVNLQGAATLVNAPTSGGALALQVNANSIVVLTAALIAPQVSSMTWAQGVSNPTIGQSTPTSDLSTQNLVLSAQSAFSGASTFINGGFLILSSGDAKSDGVTGKRGAVQLSVGSGSALVQVCEPVVAQRVAALATTSSVSSTDMPANTGDCVVYVRNAQTAPTASATNGGILYAQAGALKWRGSSGTTTTLGVAEPHCPKCGADFMTEHESERYGYLSVCLRCLADEVGERPWIVRKKAA